MDSLSRRSFIGTLAALVAAPVVAPLVNEVPMVYESQACDPSPYGADIIDEADPLVQLYKGEWQMAETVDRELWRERTLKMMEISL